MAQTCDILVLAPHPDDAELHCGATIASQVRQGAVVHIVDLTKGESASRGTVAQRAEEAREAAKVLGVRRRENLGLPDGALGADRQQLLLRLVDCIRTHRPGLVLNMSTETKHPDHRALAETGWDAIKAAAIHGLPGTAGEPGWTTAQYLAYEAELPLQPDLLVPCTEADWQCKQAALACHASQFTIDDTLPATSITSHNFLQWIEQRGRSWGYHAGAAYAEAFTSRTALTVTDLRLL